MPDAATLTPCRRTLLTSLAASAISACAGGPAAPDRAEKQLLTAGTAGGKHWRQSAVLPGPRQEIYPCLHNGAIRLAGGFRASEGEIDGPTRSHALYLSDTGKWVTTNELPVARHHLHMESFDGLLLTFAGFESPSKEAVWVMQSSGWAYQNAAIPTAEDPRGTFWRAIPDLPVPCGEAVTGVTGDGMLHLAGGRTPRGAANRAYGDHVDTDHHYVLDRIAGRWQSAAPCLTKRNSAAGDIIDGHLHIVGGRRVGAANVADHEIYDYREDRWRTAAPLPQAQAGLAAAALNGKLYAFGGEYFENGGGVYGEGWVYDPASDAWSPLPRMPHPRHGLGAVALKGAIYLIGGALKAGGNATSDIVDIYQP